MVATAMHLLDRLEAAAAERQPPRPAWDPEALRPFIQLFREWFAHATAVLGLARQCKAHGRSVEGLHDFVHRYNLSKSLAVDFDKTVETQASWERGERRDRPLEEVMDELGRQDGTACA